jgi:hypothetical protein
MNAPQRSTNAMRSRLRTVVASIDREMAQLPEHDGGVEQTQALRASWAELVELLALGPEPKVRQCPFCKHLVMHSATLCHHCWTKLQAVNHPAQD